MSVIVKEIVEDIRSNPKKWFRHSMGGLTNNEGVYFSSCGNTWLLSIITFKVNDIPDLWVGLSFIDKIRLERVYKWWLKNIPLSVQLQNTIKL